MQGQPETQEFFNKFQNTVFVPYLNGIGFVNQNENGMFRLCLIHLKWDETNSNIEQTLRQASQSKTVKIDSDYGHDFIVLHYTEWELVPQILDCLVKLGSRITLTTKWVNITYGPIKEGISQFDLVEHTNLEKFSLDEFERSFVKQIEFLRTSIYSQNIYGFKRDILQYDSNLCPLLQFYNFSTVEGRKFCSDMRQLCHVEPTKKFGDPKFDYLQFPQYQSFCKEFKLFEFGGWSKRVPKDENGNVIQGFELDQVVLDSSPANSSSSPANSSSSSSNSSSISQNSSSSPVNSSSSSSNSSSSPSNPSQSPQNSNSMSRSTLAPIAEVELCMVCMELPADTLVLPCGHQVVCIECSGKLESTLNKDLCIKCRQTIKEVFLVAS